MSQNLFALVAQSNELEQALIESGGVLTEEMEKALSTVEVNLPAKIDGYAHFLERAEMAEEFWKQKAKAMFLVAKGISDARERVKDALKLAAENLKTDELVGNEKRFKISSSKPKLVVDQANLAGQYLIERVVFEPDNDKIRDDLGMGREIEGAKLVESKSIRIYVNKGTK